MKKYQITPVRPSDLNNQVLLSRPNSTIAGQVSSGPQRRGGRPLHAELDRRVCHRRHGRHRRKNPQIRSVLEKLENWRKKMICCLERWNEKFSIFQSVLQFVRLNRNLS